MASSLKVSILKVLRAAFFQPYGLPTSNQNKQQRFNYNVVRHDVMGKVALVERCVSLPKHHPIAVIEASSRISLTWTLVNTLNSLPSGLPKPSHTNPYRYQYRESVHSCPFYTKYKITAAASRSNTSGIQLLRS